jgi:hypothetical protein
MFNAAMTEAEWLACTDPKGMLAFLDGRASDRKLRLRRGRTIQCRVDLNPPFRRGSWWSIRGFETAARPTARHE